MKSYNRVILLGNLTRDPELRYIPSGMAVTDIGLAVNERRKKPDGEWVEETTFVDVTLWERTAEVVCEYLSKGSPILVEGRLKLDTWEGTDGQKRSKLKVIGDRMVMVGAPGAGRSAGAGAGDRPVPRQSAQPSQATPPQDDFDASMAEPPGGNDIPF